MEDGFLYAIVYVIFSMLEENQTIGLEFLLNYMWVSHSHSAAVQLLKMKISHDSCPPELYSLVETALGGKIPLFLLLCVHRILQLFFFPLRILFKLLGLYC